MKINEILNEANWLGKAGMAAGKGILKGLGALGSTTASNVLKQTNALQRQQAANLAGKQKQAQPAPATSTASTLIDPNTGKPFVPTAGTELQKAAMAGSQATAAVGDTRSELQKAAAPGAQAGTQVTQPAPVAPQPRLHPDVGVVSSHPVVLRYKKQDYALNQFDHWVRFGTNKDASPEMAQFLNKQLQAL
jgi:hypothetical protein